MKTHAVPRERTAVKAAAAGPLKQWAYSQKAAPYIFVTPFVISFLLFFAYPVYSTVVMSFQEVLPGATKFVGFANYSKLLNPTYYTAIRNSATYTFWTLVVLIPLPLIVAVLLNAGITRFKNFFRSTLFIPALTSVIVAGTIFRLVFSELPGAVANNVLHVFGYGAHKWMANPGTAMFVLVLLATWRWLGINVVYFLSGLQSIPSELYESAEIDGATARDKLMKITLPLLKPVTIYVLTISVYGGFAMFTESFTMYNGNRSPKDIGLTMVGYIYQQGFEQFNLGFGSAIGLSLLGITMIVNVLQLRFFGMFRKED